MARIRSIKPEFFTSEQVVDCSPHARLLFVGMWCFADDSGIHPASEKRLKMEVFPGDDFTATDIRRMVDELRMAGLLIEYEAQGQLYWKVTGWQHQKIEKPTKRYPLPIDGFADPMSSSSRRMVVDRSAPEWRGVESNGGETKGEENPPYPPSGGGVRDESAFASLSPGDPEATPADEMLVVNAPSRIPPDFDQRIDKVVWPKLVEIQQDANHGARPIMLTENRRWAISEALERHTPEEIAHGWHFCLQAAGEKAVAIREKWNGIDTYLRPDKITGYIELAYFKPNWTRTPPKSRDSPQGETVDETIDRVARDLAANMEGVFSP